MQLKTKVKLSWLKNTRSKPAELEITVWMKTLGPTGPPDLEATRHGTLELRPPDWGMLNLETPGLPEEHENNENGTTGLGSSRATSLGGTTGG